MNKELFTSNRDDWGTPSYVYNYLNKEFHFTLDACANKNNYKHEHYYDIATNGLTQDWSNEVVFCNPPYGLDQKQWLQKAYDESKNGVTTVFLIPARTDTQVFHKYIWGRAAEIRFIYGRIKFEVNRKAQDRAPFPSMIVVYREGTDKTEVSTIDFLGANKNE
ncbi:MAG: phage N-6-adenine-methyltransferase [Lachnospiraceae bacterium]|nr:phage N-6-adenine-methyltransferase [Lachnospiraceae bacterium]